MNTIKKVFIVTISIIFLLCLYGCNINRVQESTQETTIKNTIKNYYTKSYDMWMKLKIGSLSEYLDLESVQCYNKTIALEENIEKWRYAIEKGYFKGNRDRHNIDFAYKSIEIADNDAKVKVILSGETSGSPAYPFFVSLGENMFKLKKVRDKWLVYDHDYKDVYFYEK
ncbi:hypothetical protein [Abyssisolibacter fermentans]|uniref:hypothetical protein n=1 Tax=Abyssisolibacter fermentans TaxID=1766203 RepID=UPI0008302E81|nr:hypothetical protein [Abyssisolibacter fermentans]